jgi:hypothetical protein
MRFAYAAILLTVIPLLAGEIGFDDPLLLPPQQLLPGRRVFA